jgi:hypothetical protein
MNTEKLNLTEVVNDIRAGMDQARLVVKYGLSPKNGRRRLQACDSKRSVVIVSHGSPSVIIIGVIADDKPSICNNISIAQPYQSGGEKWRTTIKI